MSDVVIRAENLGKKYRIQHQQERQRYVALRDVLAGKMLAPWRWIKSPSVNCNGHSINPQSSTRNDRNPHPILKRPDGVCKERSIVASALNRLRLALRID
jgi:hypothetical protein